MSANDNQLTRYGAIAKSLPRTLGKVFFVAHADSTYASDLLSEFPNDVDGVPRVYLTTSGASTDDLAIQAALDACVTGRNDYVIIAPGRYVLSAKLEIKKNSVHVLGAIEMPAIKNIGASASTSAYGGPVLFGPTADDVFEIGSTKIDTVEIAYLDIRAAVDSLAIDFGGASGSVYRPWIHDCGIGIGTSTGYSAMGISSQTAGYRINSGIIEDNFFYVHTHASGTNDGISSYLYIMGRDNLIRNNYVNLGGTKCTYGIREHSTYKGGNVIDGLNVTDISGDFSYHVYLDNASDASSYVKRAEFVGTGLGTMRVAVGRSLGCYTSGFSLTAESFKQEIVDNKIALGRQAGHSLVLGHEQP